MSHRQMRSGGLSTNLTLTVFAEAAHPNPLPAKSGAREQIEPAAPTRLDALTASIILLTSKTE
jgi:hypothetical protein